MDTSRYRIRLCCLAAFLLCGGIAVRAQMPGKLRHRADSLFAVAQDKSRPDGVRMSAFNQASFTVYKDVAYGLKITAAYAETARTMKRPADEMAALSFMGMGYLSIGKLDSAALCFSEELRLALQNNDLRKKGDALANLGLLYEAKGDLDSALLLHNQSLANAVVNKFGTQMSRAKINIGHVYELQGKYIESMHTFQEALGLCLKVKAVGFYPSVYISLGEVNTDIGEDSTAERYFRQALWWASNNYNHGKRIQAFQKIGRLHEARNRYDSALVYYTRAYELAKEQGMISYMAGSRSGMASVCKLQDSTARAWTYILESIRLYETSRIVAGSDEAYLLAGEIELGRKHLSESFRLLMKGYTIARAGHNVKNIVRASRLLYQAERLQGNDRAAIGWIENYDSLSKVLADRESMRSVMKMQLNNEFRQQKLSDSLRNAEKLVRIENAHLQTEQEQKRRFYFVAGGAVVLLILFLAGLYVYRQKRKAGRELEEKNREIEQALKDKNVLLREVNHRVKNNMQIVSSLLELKSRNTTSEQVREALLDSRARITAMQLAHQKMYQNDDYEKIDVTEYCREIMVLLLPAKSANYIHGELEGESFFAHVEQAQALGFILHELITNSIRHAWSPGEKDQAIYLSCICREGTVHFSYRDNGKGLPAGFELSEAGSFGMRLVFSLVERQLMGTIKTIPGNGIHLVIEFTAR